MRSIDSFLSHSHSSLTLIVGLILGLFGLTAGAPVQAQDSTTTDSYFSYRGEVSVSLSLDQVGVVPARGVGEDELLSFADTNGYTVDQIIQNKIYILGLSQSQPRSEIVALARDLRRTESVIGQAGLVTSTGGRSPFVITDQFVAKFDSGLSRSEIEELNNEYGVEILLEDPGASNAFLLTVTASSDQDALDTSTLYHELPETEFAEPNLVLVRDVRQTIPNDPFFGNQWHHQNTGQNGGSIDGDLDTPKAWDVTTGNSDVVVGVLDTGYDVDGSNPHPDLAPNLWQNPGETAGNGADDDGNGYVDDVNGWDFGACSPDDDGDGKIDEDPVDGTDDDSDGQVDEDPKTPATCGDNSLAGGSHGTSTAGAAAAEGDNGIGVSGTCPDCRLMLIRRLFRSPAQPQALSIWADRLAFEYARTEGADVITNSWGYVPRVIPNTVVTKIQQAANQDIPVFWAMSNQQAGSYVTDCQSPALDMSSLQSVFAVSASNNLDTRSPAGYGDCMEMVAPTFEGGSAPGTLGATTTDVQGSQGYNSGALNCPSSFLSNNDYTRCFGGTSFATPAVAGVAGLLLSTDPNLSRTEVERLLQDTGNKIQDSMAVYDSETGFSDPNSGPSTGMPATSSHGYGRVNAAEAVRVANQGVDLFVRDNRLDWGNTEQPSSTKFPSGFINWWHSVDVKVDAPPYDLSSPVSASDFANFQNEDPLEGLQNHVYVRVRNRGPSAASDVDVTLRYAFAGTGLPPWQPNSQPKWGTRIGQKTVSTVPYSGASVAGGSNDPAKVVQFDWIAPAPRAGSNDPDHFCLLAQVGGVPADSASPQQGPLRNFVPADNNFTLDNLSVRNTQVSIPPGGYEINVGVSNPTDQTIETEVTLDRPEGWDTSFEEYAPGTAFSLDPGGSRTLNLRVFPPERGATGTVEVQQTLLGGSSEENVTLGGVTYRFAPREGLAASSGLTIPGDGNYYFGNTGLSINFSNLTTEGPVTVRRFNTRPQDESGISEENVSSYTFTIDSGIMDGDASAELRFDVAQLAGLTEPEGVTIYTRPDSTGGEWSPLPTTYDSGTNTLRATVSEFSEFVFASNSDPLPVELAAFDATLTNEAVVKLSWTTASETRNAEFRVQRRAADGSARRASWTTLGRIDGRGTANASTAYTFVDDDLPYAADSLSYRLKQVDTDGSASFTDPVTVQRNVDAVTLVRTFPNPASQQATLRYALPHPQSVQIRLYDVLGREVRTIVQGRQEGRQEVQIDVSDLSSGVYILRLNAGNTVKTRRLTVAH